MQAAGRKPNYFVGPLLLTILAAAVAGVLALVLSVGAKPAEATFQGPKSKIAFASDRGGNFDIWVMNADGTNPVQLTSNSLRDVFPAWSPDGEKIAFVRGDPGPDREIWLMNADGTGQTQLTSNRVADIMPTRSPDGKKIAFSDHACTGESNLFVMKANGKGVTQLFETPENETGAAWSPDGGRIAFERYELDDQGFVPGSGEIYVIGEDGGRLTNLTNYPDADDQHPDWAPEQDD